MQMKRFIILIAGCMVFVIIFSSCFNYHNNGVSISIKEDEEEYQLSARFDERKTRMVQNYIKECTESKGLFRYGGHGNLDARLTLDDNTRVYIKSREGRLKIKLDKEENSEESYERIKQMCEGVKDLLAEN